MALSAQRGGSKGEEEFEFVLDITVPPNSTARVRLPGAHAEKDDKEVGSGTYTFRGPYLKPQWPPKLNYGAFYRDVGEDDDI